MIRKKKRPLYLQKNICVLRVYFCFYLFDMLLLFVLSLFFSFPICLSQEFSPSELNERKIERRKKKCLTCLYLC